MEPGNFTRRLVVNFHTYVVNSVAGRQLKNSPISRFRKENTPFRKGKSKEDLLRNTRQFQQQKSKHYRRRNIASRTICGFIKPTSKRTSQINFYAADFLGYVRVLLGIQQTKNNRLDCEFVLKYYSN